MAAAAVVQFLIALLQASATAGAADLRFHHLHLRVADPATAAKEAAAHLGGTITILQGHGVGVRAGDEYLIFVREDESLLAGDSRLYGTLHTAAVYLQATRWASNNGLTIAPAQFDTVRVRDAVPAVRIDRVAFSTADPAAIVDRLAARGVTPSERTEDVARYTLSPELSMEIVRETDRPDTHWCPMHPDVRSSAPGKCSLCGMPLVPIPPPSIGEYRLDVTVIPASHGAGSSGLRLVVKTPTDTERVIRFLEVHQKTFHLFIVSRDLTRFAHLHPEQGTDGTFVLDYPLEPGEYVLIADFVPAGGTPQMLHRAIVTPGYSGALFNPGPRLDKTSLDQISHGFRVRLEVDGPSALRRSRLRFVVSDAHTGAAVADLEPFLGASGHLLIVNPDLTNAIHAHPEGSSTTGPAIVFDPVFPTAGVYKLWVQFQRQGNVVTVPFVIDVAPR